MLPKMRCISSLLSADPSSHVDLLRINPRSVSTCSKPAAATFAIKGVNLDGAAVPHWGASGGTTVKPFNSFNINSKVSCATKLSALEPLTHLKSSAAVSPQKLMMPTSKRALRDNFLKTVTALNSETARKNQISPSTSETRHEWTRSSVSVLCRNFAEKRTRFTDVGE